MVGALTRRRRRFVYLGWQGNGNFGDDLILDAWRFGLSDPLRIQSVVYRREFRKHPHRLVLDQASVFGAERLLLLGGGITLGFAKWASHVRAAIRLYRPSAIVIAGSGAAESTDSYSIATQQQDWSIWRELENVDLLGVRGPLTRKEVEAHWRKTIVLGDPALMYPVTSRSESSRPASRRLGVCVGSGTSTRYDLRVVADACKRLAARLHLSPMVFQLSRLDKAVSTELSILLNGAPITAYEGNVKEMVSRISATYCFISERLHGVVIARSIGVPTLLLSYASKCDDFWLSVTNMRPRIYPGSSASEIVDVMEQRLGRERADEGMDMAQQLRTNLLGVASLLRAWRGHRLDSLRTTVPA